MTPAELADRLGGKRSGAGWMARCPGHDDGTASLAIGEGDNGATLLHCLADCTLDRVLAALGMSLKDLAPPSFTTNGHADIHYRYDDENNKLLFEVVRKPGKKFLQRRPDGAGGWIWKRSERLILYRLPQVIKAVANGETVYIVEGEKDVDRVAAEGYCATCNPMGAGKWNKVAEHARSVLANANVVVCRDRDEAGRRHADDVVASLLDVTTSVVLVEPAEGKDTSDHLAAGYAVEQLVEVDGVARATGIPTSRTGRYPTWTPDRDVQVVDDANTLADGFRATDVGNASRLIAAAGRRLRYAHEWSKWLVYQNGVWVIDSSEALVTEQAKAVARNLFRLAADLPGDERHTLWKFAMQCEHSSAIGNMLRLARGIPGVLVDIKQLDADPWLLNVINGTVDLITGRLRNHDPDDLQTMQAPVIFDAHAVSSRWLHCVERWQPDPLVRGMLQRAVGTGITGQAMENLFVNVGTGGNGKSKFFGALADVLGPFCVTPHKSLLVASKHEGHPTHLASLFRARMLIAPETSQDERLDEELVKNLTGGDTLRARRMREDEWSFRPTHTAFIHSNYKPRIRGVDEGIWRRVRLIPWSVTIPADERDDRLADKLRAESSGILNWLIAGVLEYQRRGLDEPQSVLAATKAYRHAEDHLGKFINDTLIVDDNASISAGHLREIYESWCSDAGENPWTPTRFGRDLDARGYDGCRMGQPQVRHRLGLRAK